jgi:hypothetical protein
MSEQEPPLENTDAEDAKLYVADPDDYAKTRKLKALADAKANVRKVRKNRPGTATNNEWENLDIRLAEAVALYGNELMPLLEEAKENGVIGDDDLDIGIREGVTVGQYIVADGQIKEHDADRFEPAPPHVAMAVYRQLQKIERKLGLGLSLHEEDDDDWTIQT